MDSLEALASQASSVAQSLAALNNRNNNNCIRRSTSLQHDGQHPQQHHHRASLVGADDGRQRAGVTFAPSATVLGAPNELYSGVGSRHVIPVAGPPPVPVAVHSPEGEVYGFGRRFKEGSRDYFSAIGTAWPSNQRQQMAREQMQNQMFLDSLSAKLTGEQEEQAKSRQMPSYQL